MARQSYSLDGAVIGEQADFDTEAVAYNITTFGWISSIEIEINREVTQFKGVKGGSSGHLFNRNIEFLKRITGTITFSPIDLKFLKYGLGDYGEAAGDYTVASQADMPTFLSLKGNYDGTKAIKLIGLAFNNMNVRVSTGNVLELTATFTAKSISTITESIMYTQPSSDPLTYIDVSIVSLGFSRVALVIFTMLIFPSDHSKCISPLIWFMYFIGEYGPPTYLPWIPTLRESEEFIKTLKFTIRLLSISSLIILSITLYKYFYLVQEEASVLWNLQ